jgi:hypothetical protein
VERYGNMIEYINVIGEQVRLPRPFQNRRGVALMKTYETLSLMIAFAMLIIAILMFRIKK